METLNRIEFYNRLAKAFDVMTDWRTRLAQEMPFLQGPLDSRQARGGRDTGVGQGQGVLSRVELVDAMQRMRAKLNSGGVVILHNLNYDLRLKTKPRFFSASGNADTLVWRLAG